MWGKGKLPKKDQLVIGLLTGVLLIVAAWPFDSGKAASSKTEKTGAVAEDSPGMEGQEKSTGLNGNTVSASYMEEMEARLADALSLVEGVGRVQVLITWKTSSERVVEKDVPENVQTIEEKDASGGARTTEEKDREESTVYQEDGNGGRTPYVVKEIEPVPEGVLVIAQGGGNGVVARNILEAVQALFPLEAHKIKIMKMEGSK